MWYAIEYAYGSRVVNNGNRANKAYQFTSRRLRDAWVAAGEPNMDAPGCRDVLSSRSPIVRNAIAGLHDGDGEAWSAIARQRVSENPELARYADLIFEDWAESDHNKWVATAPQAEIVSWAKSVKEAQSK